MKEIKGDGWDTQEDMTKGGPPRYYNDNLAMQTEQGEDRKKS